MRIRHPLITVASVLVFVAALLVASAGASAPDTPRRPACTITGTNGPDRLNGTSGPDVICALGGNDDVFGRGGDDLLILGRGSDWFMAGAGDDLVFAGGQRDSGYGDRGNDRIYLQRGEDWAVWAYFGADVVSGGKGKDDCLNVADGKGNDRVRGGPGRDIYDADASDAVRSAEIGPVDCGGV